MAETHAEAFPDLYATNMGADYLEAFYASYLRNGIAIVAEADGEIAGVVIGGTQQIRHEFMRSSMKPFALRLAYRFVTNRVVFAAVFSQFKNKFTRPQPKQQPVTPPTDSDRKNAWLQVICVRQQMRGSDVARPLFEEFKTSAALHGYGGIQLSVAKKNARALGFYQKHGFYEVSCDEHHFLLETNV